MSNSIPPHAITETPGAYSICFNLLGIDQKNIGVDVSVKSREVAVFAKRPSYGSRRSYFWVFGVPTESPLEMISARYKQGVLEITIPKY